MEQIIIPQNVIDTENEKRLIQNGFSDYCTKLCPERYKKLTGERRCFCAFQGVEIINMSENLDTHKYLQIICTVESDYDSGGYTSVKKLIDVKELRQLYKEK